VGLRGTLLGLQSSPRTKFEVPPHQRKTAERETEGKRVGKINDTSFSIEGGKKGIKKGVGTIKKYTVLEGRRLHSLSLGRKKGGGTCEEGTRKKEEGIRTAGKGRPTVWLMNSMGTQDICGRKGSGGRHSIN